MGGWTSSWDKPGHLDEELASWGWEGKGSASREERADRLMFFFGEQARARLHRQSLMHGPPLVG
jgi:hypothetical protein